MRKAAGKDVGNMVEVEIEFDPDERIITMHPKLLKTLEKNKDALGVFESLPPSRQKGIIRYISHLKTEESPDKNVARAIGFLKGDKHFIGRDKPK